MNNDELDREIKLVQLQRERLALAREMAFQGVGGTAKNIGKTIGRAVVDSLSAVWRFFTRWWKVPIYIAIASGCVGAGIAWVKRSDQEAIDRWNAGMNAQLEACPITEPICGTSYGYYNCIDGGSSERRICQDKARSKYIERVPKPRPWFK